MIYDERETFFPLPAMLSASWPCECMHASARVNGPGRTGIAASLMVTEDVQITRCEREGEHSAGTETRITSLLITSTSTCTQNHRVRPKKRVFSISGSAHVSGPRRGDYPLHRLVTSRAEDSLG